MSGSFSAIGRQSLRTGKNQRLLVLRGLRQRAYRLRRVPFCVTDQGPRSATTPATASTLNRAASSVCGFRFVQWIHSVHFGPWRRHRSGRIRVGGRSINYARVVDPRIAELNALTAKNRSEENSLSAHGRGDRISIRTGCTQEARRFGTGIDAKGVTAAQPSPRVRSDVSSPSTGSVPRTPCPR